MNRRRVTYSQLQALWEFLNSHREIASGYNKSAQAREHSKKMWARIANSLNALRDGAAKSGPEWSKYWVDLKAKLKKKNRVVRDSLRGTGGGPPTETLSEMDIKFLQLLGDDFGCGLVGVQVPLFPETQPRESHPSDQPNQSRSGRIYLNVNTQPAAFSQSSSEPIYLDVNTSADITQTTSHLSDQASQRSSGRIYLDIDISEDIIASEHSAETPPSVNSEPTHLISSTAAIIHSNVQRPIDPHQINTTSSPIRVATLNPVPIDRGEDQIEVVPTEAERRPNANPPSASSVPQESRTPNAVLRNRRTRQRRRQQMSAADARERLVTVSEARARAELANSHSIREGVEILREIVQLLRNRFSAGAAAALPTGE